MRNRRILLAGVVALMASALGCAAQTQQQEELLGYGGGGAEGLEPECPELRGGEHTLSYDGAAAADVLVEFQDVLGCPIYVEDEAVRPLIGSKLSFQTGRGRPTREVRDQLETELLEDNLALRKGPGFYLLQYEPIP